MPLFAWVESKNDPRKAHSTTNPIRMGIRMKPLKLSELIMREWLICSITTYNCVRRFKDGIHCWIPKEWNNMDSK